jgi:hypothetical protein
VVEVVMGVQHHQRAVGQNGHGGRELPGLRGGGEGVDQQRPLVAHHECDVHVEHRVAQHEHPVGDLHEGGHDGSPLRGEPP